MVSLAFPCKEPRLGKRVFGSKPFWTSVDKLVWSMHSGDRARTILKASYRQAFGSPVPIYNHISYLYHLRNRFGKSDLESLVGLLLDSLIELFKRRYVKVKQWNKTCSRTLAGCHRIIALVNWHAYRNFQTISDFFWLNTRSQHVEMSSIARNWSFKSWWI